MSTKTTFKRVALVAVASLGLGVMTSVAPAQAELSALQASVGVGTVTNLTVVGASPRALVRLDVTTTETSAAGVGLSAGETIVADVTAVPAGKTLAANGGSMVDTSTAVGSARSDFSILESGGQTSGVAGTAIAAGTTTTSIPTNWALTVPSVSSITNLDSANSLTAAQAADAVITSSNSKYINKDSRAQISTGITTSSYYVTIIPRTSALVLDQGAYTFRFQLLDAAGAVRGTSTVTIDFVSTAATSDAVLTLATAGTFLTNATLATTDATGYAAYATLTVRNRAGGYVRGSGGGAVQPTVSIRDLAATPVADTMTVTASDSGVSGTDFGSNPSAGATGAGTLQANNGVFGLGATLPATATSADQTYQFRALYGNATIATASFTLFGATGTAVNTNTDVLVTAAGMSAADQLTISNDADANYNWTVPTSTKSATVKFTIQSGSTNIGAADITVTPTWSGSFGTANVTPATSTTGTVYTTDALGNFTVTVTNSAPVDTAKLTLVLTGGKAFGTTKYTASITWAAPVATTIAVADPLSGVYVKTGSTNITTVIVKDQFGNAVKDQAVSVSLGSTSANYSATTTIAPITTGANGTATYSLVGGATTATLDTLTFQCVPTACGTAATMTYNYVSTVPAVATMSAYHDLSWGTSASTLTPATGIYATGTTKLILEDARNISKALSTTSDANTTNDEISLRFYALASGSVAATGAVVTVTAGDGGWILDAAGLPAKSRNFLVNSTGYTNNILVMATKPGAITFTATSGTVTATAAMWVADRLATDNSSTAGRFVTVTGAATGTANGTGTPVTVTVTDRYGNPVSGVALNVVASGVGSFMGGNITQSFTTDASGTYTFLANTSVSEGGVAKFTATTGTAGSFSSAAGYVGAQEVDATLAAGNSSASASITFAAGSSATDVAQAATDAAAEATDAANAATDAANAAAEAADAATAAAQDAADAVAALSTQVSEMVNALKKQITALTNLVIKIQKKVKA